VSTFWQGTVSGVILIAAVGMGVLRDRGYALRPRRKVVAPPPEPVTESR
jgi:ribose transport system permease protein